MDEFTFSPSAAQWRLDNAFWLSAAAQLAYQTASEVRPIVAGWGLNRFVACESHAARGFAAGNHEVTLVAFRGTTPGELRDWLTNVQFKLVPAPVGLVHEGFWRAFSTLSDNLLTTVRALRDADQPLWITGHSLGGALAVLAAAWLQEVHRIPVQGVVTLGTPRVGHREFAMRFHQQFDGRAFRVVNDDDPVTRVPPRQFDYAHVGALQYFDEFGRLHREFTWWRKLLETVVARRWQDLFNLGQEGVKDHRVERYVQLLRAAWRSES